ncbi:MAG: AbiV family abortive infection protein [Thermoplasmata archaeon]|nr:AbiV family abortive infection protein [Thermoplasmata archaeon]
MSSYDLDCSIEEAKAICQTLSQHILKLSTASGKALSTQLPTRRAGTVRPAYVLTLLALEETGQMFKIWQTGAKAEDDKTDRVLAENLFRDHEMKGGLASDLCCQMFETVANWFLDMQRTEDPKSQSYQVLSEVKEDFDKAVVHLKGVYQAYKAEREATMYVSDDGNVGWDSRSQTISEVITTENLLIWIVAFAASSYLTTKGSFSLAIRALLDIRKGSQSDQAYAFYGRMTVGLAQQLAGEREEGPRKGS